MTFEMLLFSNPFPFGRSSSDSCRMSSPKLDNPPIRREEIEFEHDDKVFVYVFHRFEDGKITFERVNLPHTAVSKKNPQQDVLYPSGTPTLISIAILVLYKASQQGTAEASFVREILAIFVGDISEEACYSGLKAAIASFSVSTPVAKLGDVMQFVEPYSKWKTVLDAFSPGPELGDVARSCSESIPSPIPFVDNTIPEPTPSSEPAPSSVGRALQNILQTPAKRSHTQSSASTAEVPWTPNKSKICPSKLLRVAPPPFDKWPITPPGSVEPPRISPSGTNTVTSVSSAKVGSPTKNTTNSPGRTVAKKSAPSTRLTKTVKVRVTKEKLQNVISGSNKINLIQEEEDLQIIERPGNVTLSSSNISEKVDVTETTSNNNITPDTKEKSRDTEISTDREASSLAVADETRRFQEETSRFLAFVQMVQLENQRLKEELNVSQTRLQEAETLNTCLQEENAVLQTEKAAFGEEKAAMEEETTKFQQENTAFQEEKVWLQRERNDLLLQLNALNLKTKEETLRADRAEEDLEKAQNTIAEYEELNSRFDVEEANLKKLKERLDAFHR